MYYTRLQVTCDPLFSEILMAEMADAGFESFMETETGFEAYTESDNFDKAMVAEIGDRYHQQTPLGFLLDKIEKRNWNEDWEKSYQPIDVEGRCLIRASFHQADAKFLYDIVITPKMSFGTGHHQTTYLMIQSQLEIDHRNKRVMDAGCGTAILSIMASKAGASEVEAFDIDAWSVVNGKENIDVNNGVNITLRQGTLAEVKPEGKFDIVLANINKNVLLAEIRLYASYLDRGGLLLLSGFYTHDIPDLLKEACSCGLREVNRRDRETWASLLLQKAPV